MPLMAHLFPAAARKGTRFLKEADIAGQKFEAR